MARLEYAALYAGANILILLVLAAVVVMNRRRHKIEFGDGGHEQMARAIRAHANAAEYIPAGLGGLILLALLEPAAPTWLLHGAGISLTLGRVLHGWGLNRARMTGARRIGVALTWVAYLIMGLGLIYAGLAQQL
jgi:uncharacterized protein